MADDPALVITDGAIEASSGDQIEIITDKPISDDKDNDSKWTTLQASIAEISAKLAQLQARMELSTPAPSTVKTTVEIPDNPPSEAEDDPAELPITQAPPQNNPQVRRRIML